MRPRHLITILALGLLGRTIYRVWQARRAAGARRRDAEIDAFAADPSDPVHEIIDDEDVLSPPHRAIRHDVPVADHGAGGRRGL